MSIPFLSQAIAYGGDYNPEQWPESYWIEDVELMKAAGVNLVTVGVFSWSQLQTAEDAYDFGWLDRVLDLLAAHGIGVDLATATASPPPWLSHRYPDVLAVDLNGQPSYPGSRQHYSPCSPAYRRFALELVRRLAERYGRHPAVKAWHINNEYMCHVRECHSESSTRAFRQWLKEKYGTLAALNEAWGTAFWSQGYGKWEEIFTPRRAPYHSNPTQCLDFKRFTNDAFLSLYRMELAILRQATPRVPVTTNFMGFHKPLDQHRWAGEMDFASWDCYPDPTPGAGGAESAAAGHDLTRSLKKGRPFVLMEQAASAVNWRQRNAAKPAGLMRLWSLQAIARGGDGVMFFQWRASRGGAEKYHSAMLPHGPAERSRTFAEICELGRELRLLAPVAGTTINSRVAVVLDWPAWWALELEGKPRRMDYGARVQEIHAHFFRQNVAVDFVPAGADLSSYHLVVAPALYLVSKSSAENLDRFVQGGGTLLATFFTGIVDENEQVVLGGYGGHLRATLGLWVEEWFPLPEGGETFLRFPARRARDKCRVWCERIRLAGAAALATFTRDGLAGEPAVTHHRRGRGHAYYLGTQLSPEAMDWILARICAEACVHPVLRAPPGVECTLRESPGAQYLFLLNHGARGAKVPLGLLTGHELLTGRHVVRSLLLPPLGGAVIRLDPLEPLAAGPG